MGYDMAFEVWCVFILSALGLACIPGPNSLLALSHGAQFGYKENNVDDLWRDLWFLLIDHDCHVWAWNNRG